MFLHSEYLFVHTVLVTLTSCGGGCDILSMRLLIPHCPGGAELSHIPDKV
jgi:hypothetical protein